MKIRHDLFGVYKGREYRVALSQENSLELISLDVADLKNGFTKYSEGVYYLPVKKEDLETYYDINTYALYKGHEFVVESVSGDRVLLITRCTKQLAETLGLEAADRGFYEKRVKEEELEKVWEKKSSVKL